MPTIHLFKGIRIKMHLREKEHNPPHIHAEYGETAASFYIDGGKIYEGKFPNKQQRIVARFINKHKDELLEMLETGIYHRIGD